MEEHSFVQLPIQNSHKSTLSKGLRRTTLSGKCIWLGFYFCSVILTVVLLDQMNINEAASLLGFTREQVLDAITGGVKLPNSDEIVKLPANGSAPNFDVSDAQLDEFLGLFEAEEPGRYPPAAVRRELLVEAKHICAVCRREPVQEFHHMIEFSRLKHHDPKRMLALCGTDHNKCSKGQIDYKSQQEYKAKLLSDRSIHTIEKNDKRQASDLETTRKLFNQLHTGTIAYYLEEGRGNRIFHDAIYFYDSFHANLNAANVHFYDKMLKQLFVEFESHWETAINIGMQGRELPCGKFSKLRVDYNDNYEQSMLELEKFGLAIAETDSAFRLLFEYVRETFPDLDVKKTDEYAWAEFKR